MEFRKRVYLVLETIPIYFDLDRYGNQFLPNLHEIWHSSISCALQKKIGINLSPVGTDLKVLFIDVY